MLGSGETYPACIFAEEKQREWESDLCENVMRRNAKEVQGGVLNGGCIGIEEWIGTVSINRDRTEAHAVVTRCCFV